MASAGEKYGIDPCSPRSVFTGVTLGDNGDLEAAAVPPCPDKQPWLSRCLSHKPSPNAKEINETITRKLEDCQLGYPRLAGFLSSESSFSQYRGFHYLHSRVLLELQHEIATLERELDQLDRRQFRNGEGDRLRSRARDIEDDEDDEDAEVSEDDEPPRTRQDILADIRKRLVEYDELLIKSRKLISFQRPSQRDYRSVRTWFDNKKPLVDEEQAFIKRKEDILTLRHGREWSGFDGLVESTLRKFDCRPLRWLFCTKELREKTNDECVYYYSQSRVDILISILITGIIFILLVLPVVALYRLTSFGGHSDTFDAIGVLVVFTLLFAAAMSMLTKARRHELFAASAGYAAVLVVFITNFNGASTGSGAYVGPTS